MKRRGTAVGCGTLLDFAAMVQSDYDFSFGAAFSKIAERFRDVT